MSLFNNTSIKPLNIGEKAPSFTLKDQNGQDFDIDQYIGKKKLVIYFYPKDESMVCTQEACAFRDSFADFSDAGAMVIGINSGSVESHKAFQQKNRLPFTLLSDPENAVLKLFGVKNKLFLTGRETFLVDLSGKIVYKFQALLSGKEHSEKVLDFLKNSN
jgi:thioredoxin-dependent peroxiredoxin